MKGLTPKQQAELEKWQSTTVRRIVLNKKRESQVMSRHASNLKRTKADCILIEIKVSDQHEELKIRSGEGDWYNLFADTTSVDFQTGVGS